MTLRHIGELAGGRVLAVQKTMQSTMHRSRNRVSQVTFRSGAVWTIDVHAAGAVSWQPGTHLLRQSSTRSAIAAGPIDRRSTATQTATTILTLAPLKEAIVQWDSEAARGWG